MPTTAYARWCHLSSPRHYNFPCTVTVISPVASIEFDSDSAVVMSGDSCWGTILTFDLTSSNVRDYGKHCLTTTSPSLAANAFASKPYHAILFPTGDARDHVFEQTLSNYGEDNGVGANFNQIGRVGADERAHGATKRDVESDADSPDRNDGVVETANDLELEELNARATLEYQHSQKSCDENASPCVSIPSSPRPSEPFSLNLPSPGEPAFSSPRMTHVVKGTVGFESAGQNAVDGNDSDISCSFEILEVRSCSRHSTRAPLLPSSPCRSLLPSGPSLNRLASEPNANVRYTSNSHPPGAALASSIRHASERGLLSQETTIRPPWCDNVTASGGAI